MTGRVVRDGTQAGWSEKKVCVCDCGKGSFKLLADGETPLDHLP